MQLCKCASVHVRKWPVNWLVSTPVRGVTWSKPTPLDHATCHMPPAHMPPAHQPTCHHATSPHATCHQPTSHQATSPPANQPAQPAHQTSQPAHPPPLPHVPGRGGVVSIRCSWPENKLKFLDANWRHPKWTSETGHPQWYLGSPEGSKIEGIRLLFCPWYLAADKHFYLFCDQTRGIGHGVTAEVAQGLTKPGG